MTAYPCGCPYAGGSPFCLIHESDKVRADIIGGFSLADPNCKGCGKALLLENAWMTDGCPCNSTLGVNSMNETRWRLLMQLQQQQSRELENLKLAVNKAADDGERLRVG